MRYLKLYEEFRTDSPVMEPEILIDPENDVSDKTIDDVVGDDFFKEEEDKDVYQDQNGVYHIKNWIVY